MLVVLVVVCLADEWEFVAIIACDIAIDCAAATCCPCKYFSIQSSLFVPCFTHLSSCSCVEAHPAHESPHPRKNPIPEKKSCVIRRANTACFIIVDPPVSELATKLGMKNAKIP